MFCYSNCTNDAARVEVTGRFYKKIKILFVNFPKPVLLDYLLILGKVEGFFTKNSERGGRTAG